MGCNIIREFNKLTNSNEANPLLRALVMVFRVWVILGRGGNFPDTRGRSALSGRIWDAEAVCQRWEGDAETRILDGAVFGVFGGA